MAYKTEKSGTGKKFTEGRKAQSVGDILRGIRAGRIEQRINTYYDNIKDIDPDYTVKDPWRMSRIEQLKHVRELQEFIISHQNNNNGQNPSNSATTTTTTEE